MSSHERLFGRHSVSDGQFRLLDILPASSQGSGGASPLRCELRVASLANPPEYEALSYVWGSQDPGNEVSIEVSGEKFGATKNLHAALSSLQLHDTKRTVWADQICIDQTDKAEKSTIVPLMRQIYSRCSQALLWMGEIPGEIGSVDVESLFEFFTYMADVADLGDEGVTVPICMASEAAFKRPMRALQHMMESETSWFSRIWTVQEAILPKSAVLLWGSMSITWSTLINMTLAWTSSNGTPFPAALQPLEEQGLCGSALPLLMAVLVWLNEPKEECHPLSHVLHWRGRRAHDARDKVYALLGLLPPGRMPRIELCDYNLSTEQVYERMTVDLIAYTGNLSPLMADPRLEDDQATTGIARWVLDLKRDPLYRTDIWRQIADSAYFNADGGCTLKYRHKKGVLGLKGIFVDTIERVWVAIQSPISDEFLLGAIKSDRQLARLIINDIGRDPWGDPIRRATREDINDSLGRMRDNERGGTLRSYIFETLNNQTIFSTKTGLIGRGHRDSKAGDEVWIFNGGRVPFTVRPRQNLDNTGHTLHYDFVGHSYVEGIMDGEAYYRPSAKTQFIWIH